MIAAYRFSRDGFVPKDQVYWRNLFAQYAQDPDLAHLHPYTRSLILKSLEQAKKDLDQLDFHDWQEGVFVFLGNMPIDSTKNLELNKLTNEEMAARQWYSGLVCPDAKVYNIHALVPKPSTAAAHLAEWWKDYPNWVIDGSMVGGVPCYLPAAHVPQSWQLEKKC